jgi:hypothetical protein
MTKFFIGLCALLLVSVAIPTQAQSLGEAQQSIGDNVSSVVKNFDVKKLTQKPQRDLLTLAIGGIAGFAVGGFFSGLGILDIQVLGLAVIPMATGLAGIYMANEGYFDGLRDMVGGKPQSL